MTTPDPTQTPTVAPQPGTRLEQLHASYADAKAKADAASAELKAITDAIKLELSTAAPEGSTRIDLTGPSGPPLSLAYVERWTLDSKKLKAVDPVTYVQYARKSGSWVLRPAKADGGED